MRVVVCEAGPLTPERDAGSRAVVDLIEALTALGHDVRVIIESHGEAARQTRAAKPDVIIISRPGLFVRFEPLVRDMGKAIVYWAHDLHFERLRLQGGVDGAVTSRTVAVMRLVEHACFMRADLTVLPTSIEAERVRDEFPGARVTSTPYFAMPRQQQPTAATPGRQLIFVGGEHHAPNRDGVHWFIDRVWPNIHRADRDTGLTVVGHWSGPLSWPVGVRHVASLSDAQLDDALASSRVGIAPLRFGAGMKRKTLHYLSHGLPVVGTGYAVEGLRSDARGQVAGVVVATSESEWSEQIESLLHDDARWIELSRAGIAAVRRDFSTAEFRNGIARVLIEATARH